MSMTPRTNDRETNLPPHVDDWPHAARAALGELAGRLARGNSISRSRPAARELGVAETAIRQAWCPSVWASTSISLPPPSSTQAPSDDIRRWPPTWRYHLAELERAGATREHAIRVVAAEQREPAGVTGQIPSDDGGAHRPLQMGH